jgi:hypothetical protein
MAVKYTSIDKVARTATFDVDGVAVTRRIPAQFVGTIDDYLTSLAKGLEVESAAKAVAAKPIATPTLKAGDVVVAAGKA